MWNERTLEKPHAKITPAVRGENFSGRAALKQVRISSILMIPQYYKSYLLQNKSYSLASPSSFHLLLFGFIVLNKCACSVQRDLALLNPS